MFPNASNTPISLLNVSSVVDALGNKNLVITSRKDLVGIAKSITTNEYQTSVMLNVSYEFKVCINLPLYDGSKYALIRGKYYKIARTYVNGQFIELYLISTELSDGDFNES